MLAHHNVIARNHVQVDVCVRRCVLRFFDDERHEGPHWIKLTWPLALFYRAYYHRIMFNLLYHVEIICHKYFLINFYFRSNLNAVLFSAKKRRFDGLTCWWLARVFLNRVSYVLLPISQLITNEILSWSQKIFLDYKSFFIGATIIIMLAIWNGQRATYCHTGVEIMVTHKSIFWISVEFGVIELWFRPDTPNSELWLFVS